MNHTCDDLIALLLLRVQMWNQQALNSMGHHLLAGKRIAVTISINLLLRVAYVGMFLTVLFEAFGRHVSVIAPSTMNKIVRLE